MPAPLPTETAVFGATSGTSPSVTGVTITGGPRVLAVAYVHIGGNVDYRGTISFSSTGGLTWTLRAQGFTTPSGGAIGNEVTQVWTAPVSSTITGQTITVATSGGGTFGLNLFVQALDGANVSDLGDGANSGTQSGAGSATGSGGAASGAATVSITPQASGSMLVAAGGEYNGAAARALAGDQTMIRESLDAGNVAAHWSQRGAEGSGRTATSLATTNAIGASSGWSMAALEIEGADLFGESETAIVSDAFEMYGPAGPVSTAFQRDAHQPAVFQMFAAGTPPAATYELSETATASDVLSANKAATATLSETITVSEVFALARRAGISVSETATASDAVAMARLLGLTLTETVTVTDAFALDISAPSADYALSETATASEVFALARAAGLEVSETATASDAVALARVLGLTLSETATATDALEMARRVALGLSETATATDALALARQATLTISETATVSDAFALVIAQAGGASLSETATVSDAFAMARSIGLSFSESATVTDAFKGSFFVPTTPRRPPLVAPWWQRHRRGGRLWDK